MRHIAGQPIHVVDQNGLKQALARVVAEAIQIGPRHDRTAPTVVLVGSGDDPRFLACEAFELGYLRVNGLALPLFLGGHAGVDGEPQSRGFGLDHVRSGLMIR